MINSPLEPVIFRLSPEKISELWKFIHFDAKSLIVLTSAKKISSGAVFEEKSSMEILFEQFEKAS